MEVSQGIFGVISSGIIIIDVKTLDFYLSVLV